MEAAIPLMLAAAHPTMEEMTIRVEVTAVIADQAGIPPAEAVETAVDHPAAAEAAAVKRNILTAACDS